MPGLLRVSLQLHKRGVERRRREDRGAEGAEGVGCGDWRGVPRPLPIIFFDFGSQYGEFRCILDGIFFTVQLPVLHANPV